MLEAFKETNTLQKVIYTSSFFALGPTDGYVADEKQVIQILIFDMYLASFIHRYL